jgi:hypothetical protein
MLSSKKQFGEYRKHASPYRHFPRTPYYPGLIQQRWKINSKPFAELAKEFLPILFENTTLCDLKDDAKRKSLNFKTGTVYSLDDEKDYIKLNVRNSEKRVFRQYIGSWDGNELVECPKFKIIVDKLKPLIEATINEKDCEFDIRFHDHFDILYYPKGGFFKIHKDDTSMDTLEDDLNKGYQAYSLILGLTELTEDQINERKKNPLLLESGATVTYSNFDSKFTSWAERTTLKRHLSETTTIGNGLIFPSGMYHGAHKNYHFESVKFSIMILLKPKITSNYHMDIKDCYKKLNYKFESLLSRPQYINIMKLKNAYLCNDISNSNLKTIPDFVLLYITDFLGYLRQCHCTFKIKSIIGKKYHNKCHQYHPCKCGCKTCKIRSHNSCEIPNCQSCEILRQQEIEEEEEYQASRREYCNGRD